MNTKRSYLDTLNAGRQRRPHTTLEELSRSLESLEQRLERSREEAAGARGPHEPRYARTDPYSHPRAFEAPRPASHDDTRPVRHGPDAVTPAYQSLARDIERMRGQEDGVAMVGQIAGELRGLREELRHQMTAGLHREFQALRRDMDRAFQSAPSGHESAALGLEFERLSGAIQALAEKNDDKGVNLLRLELEQLRGAMDTLAREESVRAVDRRWDDFDRRWSALENRVGDDSGRRGDDPALAALTERLEQIAQAVDNLPESLSLRSLEEKVRTLAGAVDHFAGQQGGRAGDTLALIDERLDEISRAIVASTVAGQGGGLDHEAFARIEQRIASLAAQIEEVAQDRPSSRMLDHIDLLTRRVDELAAHAGLPQEAIERLGRQIALIAEGLDRTPAAPDAAGLLQELEQRFEVLSGMIERRQGDALEQSQMLFRDLEQRLDEMADRLDRRFHEPAFDSAGLMEAIDARFSALALRLDAQVSQPADREALRGLEDRLEDISSRLDSSAAQVASIDPDLIRSLEAQVAGLTAHLAKPDAPLPEFEDIAPRIARIEQSLAGSHETVLEAARQAAESAVQALDPANAQTPAVAGLAQDLKTLDALTRRSDERNARTFEAIHDTLLKIVERLGSLEGDAAEQERPAKIAVRDAPTIALDEPLPLTPAEDEPQQNDEPSAESRQQQRTPAEAAAAAAAAVLGAETIADRREAPSRGKSMLGGLARAFSGRRQNAAQAAPEHGLVASAPETPQTEASPSGAPDVDLDHPLEPALVNRPLEPGSGAPDLAAIMKRVRDERGQTARSGDTDSSKADFIAAARRAAQAAAAEAETLKRQSTMTGPVKALRFGDLLKARRKPILMAAAAIMLALAGLQLGKAFLPGSERTAQIDIEPATDRAAETASVTPVEQPAANELVQEPSKTEVRVVKDDADADAAQQRQAYGPAMDADTAFGVSATAGQATEIALAAGQPASPVAGMPDMEAPAPAAAVHPIDVPAAIEPAALREAAAAGDAKALFEIGSRYAEARGVSEDMAMAAEWYEKAAGKSLAPAEYRIGNFYEKGTGVTRDITKAKRWYQRAAEQGNASAMHNLAVLFAMAADGEPDNEAAAHWFQQAAELGVSDSQFNLGILTAKGAGVPQDLEASYKWFSLVAKTGDKDAAEKRDEVAKALRPEQLERARGAAELWKAKPLDPAANGVDIPAAWQDAPVTTASVDMKKAVQNIQRILNKNGYDAGGTDGVMGDRTRNAIMAFQTDNGLSATGEVDTGLVKALLARK